VDARGRGGQEMRKYFTRERFSNGWGQQNARGHCNR